MNTGLDQYMDIFKYAVEDSAAKITKSFEKILIEVIFLFIVNWEDGLLSLIPVASAKLARRLHISVVFGQNVHSQLNMVLKSWVLVSLILMPKTA